MALISLSAAIALGGSAWAQSITVWTPLTGLSLEWLQEEVAAFSDVFEVEVNVTGMALGELREQTLQSAEEGAAGDLLVGVPHDQMRELAVGGVLAGMEAYATASYLADLPDQARLAYTFDGSLFGLPLFVEGPALILNTDLVAEAPETYEALIAVAQEQTTEDSFGFIFDIENFYYAYNWIHTFGGYVFERDTTGAFDTSDIGLDNEGALRGAQALQALRFEHDLIPPETDYFVADGLFRDGVLAMTYDGPWAISAFQNAGIATLVAPIPPLADGTEWSGFMGVYGVLLNEYSDSRVDAANLAKWLVRPEAQVSLALRAGRIPASESAVALLSDDPIIAGFGAALQNAEPLPAVPEMGGVWQPMASALEAITRSPGADIAAALDRAVREIRGR